MSKYIAIWFEQNMHEEYETIEEAKKQIDEWQETVQDDGYFEFKRYFGLYKLIEETNFVFNEEATQEYHEYLQLSKEKAEYEEMGIWETKIMKEGNENE